MAKTNKQYVGLWRDVSRFRPPGDEAVLPELVEIAEVDPLVKRMAKIDRDFDSLVEHQQDGWNLHGEKPKRTPSQLAFIIYEELRESNRNLGSEFDEPFKQLLTKSARSARAVEDALQRRRFETATAHLKSLKQTCRNCHKRYRD